MQKVSFTRQLPIFIFHLSAEPLFILLSFSAILLKKHLHCPDWHITLLTCLRPLVALPSFYWSSYFFRKKHLLKKEFLLTSFIGRFPFLLLPLFPYAEYLLFCSVHYVLFARAANPAWIEILKNAFTEKKRHHGYSWAVSLSYLEGMFLSFVIASFLDANAYLFPFLFFLCACFSLVGVYSTYRLLPHLYEISNVSTGSWFNPWKEGISLLQKKKSLRIFQGGFFLCGFAVMIIQPVIYFFLLDELKIRYIEFSFASNICKNGCIVLFMPFWGRWLSMEYLGKISAYVFLLMGLFPFFLFLSSFSLPLLYVSFAIYGIAQAGSTLLWNLSGSLFASSGENSALYSGLNVIMVGIRGAIAPIIGHLLMLQIGSLAVLILSSCMSLSAFYFLRSQSSSFVKA